MASFLNENDKDELVSCPYDPVHKVKKSRLQVHINKCKQNAVEERKTCPFDALHHVSPAEYTHHLKTCPSREVVNRHLVKYSDKQEKVTADVVTNRDFVSTENWDQDINPFPMPGYDPSLSKTNRIFGDVTRMTPAERRQYYQDLHRVESENDKKEEVVTEWRLKELRQPNEKPEVLQFQNSSSSNISLGLGRGVGNASGRRIAANIFGQENNSAENALYSVAVGRGIGKGKV